MQVLGCTSPSVDLKTLGVDPVVVFLCDGRFHMEATMIANPTLKFYQYNPYTKVMESELSDKILVKFV